MKLKAQFTRMLYKEIIGTVESWFVEMPFSNCDTQVHKKTDKCFCSLSFLTSVCISFIALIKKGKIHNMINQNITTHSFVGLCYSQKD